MPVSPRQEGAQCNAAERACPGSRVSPCATGSVRGRTVSPWDKWALYLASTHTTRWAPRKPVSGMSAPMDARLPCQLRRWRASPCPSQVSPNCGARSRTKVATQASQISSASRSQARPSRLRAPPSPRSSATQPHGLHGISQPTPGPRLIPGAWAEARPGADVMAQELNAFLQRATGQGVALGGEFLVQPAQGPTHGCEDVGIPVQIGKGAREARPGASAQVAAGPLSPFDPPARASPRFGPLDETPLEVM